MFRPERAPIGEEAVSEGRPRTIALNCQMLLCPEPLEPIDNHRLAIVSFSDKQ
jgi:hypothetical protein